MPKRDKIRRRQKSRINYNRLDERNEIHEKEMALLSKRLHRETDFRFAYHANEEYWIKRIGRRYTFEAVYVALNFTNDGGNTRYQRLFRYVKSVDENRWFRQHLWLPDGNKFRDLGLIGGEIVRFTAKPNTYTKREAEPIFGGDTIYVNPEDWEQKLTLTNINNLCVVEHVLDYQHLLDEDEEDFGEVV